MSLWGIVRRIFPSRNQRVLRGLRRPLDAIAAFESKLSMLSDAELSAQTSKFRQRLAQGETLDDLLPEAFATVREASRRVLGLRHFDVQMIGGMVLHQGKIAEMRTGEGKTLVATLPAYLHALSGAPVHVVTVNEYLAQRDAHWMGRLYGFLGLTTGVISHDLSQDEKRAAYASDITYGTNNEFGFDYLRDHMVMDVSERVGRGLGFAIVDEIDSICIDEARTPLIISGPVRDVADLYHRMLAITEDLSVYREGEEEKDVLLDEKTRQAHLTESGHEKVEARLLEAGLLQEGESLYDTHNIILMHHVLVTLRARHLYHRDVDYMVKRGDVLIVDEHTGRAMPGRRWSEGLHQAVEAKEGVEVHPENQTLASITFQNFFKLYRHISGMTGTADTEAYEFQEIYGLEVVVVPTHQPMVRKDHPDRVFLTKKEKYAAIIQEIKECLGQGRPVLVGTVSIEVSEQLSAMLQSEGIKHQVLNAKFHEQEAQIIAQAGAPSTVTLATNMAGRGTDIVLGGHPNFEGLEGEALQRAQETWQRAHDAVVASGGLHIIGSERHESRRIDDQLRGRAGRQGDPGSSRFYVALDDSLIRIYSDRITQTMQRFGMQEGMSLESPMLSRVIAGAQRKVEAYHFDIRKQLLEYDYVASEQRQVVYAQRTLILEAEDLQETVFGFFRDVLRARLEKDLPVLDDPSSWNLEPVRSFLSQHFTVSVSSLDEARLSDIQDPESFYQSIEHEVLQVLRERRALFPEGLVLSFERSVFLHVLDHLWREHLVALDVLRQGIHLRGYAQQNPKQEYKREAFALFGHMLERLKFETVELWAPYPLSDSQAFLEEEPPIPLHASFEQEPSVADVGHIRRNDPCPCGSGKKYKHCHGVLVT